MYPTHSVCRFTRHTECAGYFEIATLIDSPVLSVVKHPRDWISLRLLLGAGDGGGSRSWSTDEGETWNALYRVDKAKWGLPISFPDSR